MIRKFFGLFLTLLAILASQSAYADLQAIIVGDTVSPTGGAAALDIRRVEKQLKDIKRHTGLHVNCTVLTDTQVTSDQVLKVLDQIAVGEDDVVIFYYLGHGYRTSLKKSVWPFLYLCNDARGMDLSLIVERIMLKKPRMALIVADCCNNVMDDEFKQPWEAKYPLKRHMVYPDRGYKELFVKFKGIIVACGSELGEYAYCHQGGHFYTDALLKSIKEEVVSTSPSWEKLLERARLNVKFVQNAYHEILTVY
ncbi:MAG: caspase family protein [Chlamydiales bacterium]|nr:caspase family protein [Chlamydiales bacterium]